ncbi:MAG: Nif3-like dinuclear metal center hexameric protein [Oscillospiraceae bacterium]|nr:Nif3-like dinuclear metal center hexameric protein [Oscillospiraceae bacterium]
MIIKDIYNFIDKIAPFSVIYGNDNVGLIAGSLNEQTGAVLIVLDLTDETINKAEKIGAKLVITHHPPIYKPMTRVFSNSSVYKAARAGLTVISAHTNLDIASGGVNDTLCDKLGFAPVINFADGCGRLYVPDIPLGIKELVASIKDKLSSRSVEYLKERNECKKIAIICGGGGEFFRKVADEGADTFLTGEVPYHIMLEAHREGINLICAGHFYTENVICEDMRDRLSGEFPELRVETSKWEPDVKIIK